MTMICINGKQLKPPGQSGIYFICQHGLYKGNHCRWSRWCSDSRSYISATDKYGNVCPDFSTTEIAEEQKVIDERIKEILENPCEKNLEPAEEVVEEPAEEVVEEPAEEVVEEATETTVEKSNGGISEKFVENLVDAIVDELIKQPIVEPDDESIEQPVIKILNNE